jgi:anti-sigma B factor antagonist
MEINIKELDGVNVVEFSGNLDTNTAPEAENQINGLLDGVVSKILVNFENLNYISSAGLRVLLATAKKMMVTGGDLKICSLNSTVQEVFDISGFSTILSLAANETDALAAF